MGKKVKEIILLLEINGWRHVRTRGDHRVFKKIGNSKNICVPGKDSGDLAEGTYKKILKDAGLN